MLDWEIVQELRDARAEENCTFVLEWNVRPDPTLFDDASSRRERLNRLVEFYRDLKSPLLGKLTTEGLEVTDIPTSAQAIVTAPAQQWREVVARLREDGDVRVLPNRLYTAV